MSHLKNKKVLVFGEDTRSFLTVIRALANEGMIVDVVCFSNTALALKSNCINNIFGLNHQSLTIDQWCASVEKLLCKNNYDLVIPCDERSLFPLLDIKQKLSLDTVFAVPERESLGPLFNKVDTRLTAQQCDVPVAKGELLNLESIPFNTLTEKFGLPLVLKPTTSYAEEQLNKRQSVKIAYDEKAYKEFVTLNTETSCLVESYFPGYGIGVSILADNGHVKAAFAHARVAEPETGGGSSYRKAIELDPSMLYACQKFCMKLQYTGVGMFEFKFNPKTSDWILIEINARFWGSLPLAVFAGVNFPVMLASTLLNSPVEEKLNYNTNAFARNFSADIYAIKAEFDSLKLKKGTSLALKALAKRLLGFTRLLTGNDSFDSFRWHDQKPFWAEFYSLFKDKLHKLPYIREKRQKSRIENFTSRLNSNTNELLFVCYGNIMRSPFAGKLFQQKIANSPLEKLRVDSFGFHQIENRSAKPQCVEMAKNWQIDLSGHSSKWLKESHCMNKNAIVIILDKKNEALLQAYYPEINYISLADLIPRTMGFHHEIKDPYDMPASYLKTCYELIDASVDELLNMIKKVNASNA
jgi:protein-tyrosine-phosphatase/predicted ATP-grasp superfamily ATP-dependent carboligase